MVHIFYHTGSESIPQKTIDHLLNSFPEDIRLQIVKYKNQADRNRAVLGKALLARAFEIMEMNSRLSELKYTRHHRPYFNDSFDFNISHSADLVVCAISKTHRVGIDIEKIKPVILHDFKYAFGQTDWENIISAGTRNQLALFYYLWTKQESFLKAIGAGFHQPTDNISFINRDNIIWDKEEWIIHEVLFHKGYSCHLCVNRFLPAIQLLQMQFDY